MKTDKELMREFVEMVEAWQKSQKMCEALLPFNKDTRERTAKELLIDLLVSSQYNALKQRAESDISDYLEGRE